MAAGFKTATVRAADVPSTQTDFPSYVDLDRLGVTTLAEAQSIRVYADEAKTVEWAREIVSVDEMHVKVPSLTSTVDIYVDWDGLRSDYAVGATYGRNAVWSDYKAVYHLKDLTTSTVADSTGVTGTANKIAANRPTEVDAKIGKGQDFDRSTSDYIKTPSINLSSDKATMQMWLRASDVSAEFRPWAVGKTLAEGGGEQEQFGNIFSPQVNTSSGIRGISSTISSANRIITSYATFSAATTYLLHQTFGANRLKGYLNGTEVYNTFKSGAALATSNLFIYLSARPNQNGIFSYINGWEDEFRWYDGTLSDDWISTEYNNQSDEATFWGTWTDAGGGGSAAQAARRGAVMMM